ncbi:enoyl-CoA hydratase/isomerase family protein [Devosia sp.]|uniref:enoyl-CoA hydratase/isomerase family protein n=1 Tax=Devosia sp. TaxID=1871048 RepID=UPI0025D82E7A|nr:enoyl-CoA hydratase/isomerase family protein [Devosia sp.]MCR6636466.1 enoyl-CoA hydratase/isomerase family protein [Devosia sp.]
MMNQGQVVFTKQDRVGYITFNRPDARNAMTWQMYEEFGEICRTVAADGDMRAVVLKGAGGQAFIAGSDISQFAQFSDGSDGIAYERKMEHYLSLLLDIPVPTIAVIEGFAVGGGLNIAACCDIRIAEKGARLGVPIARTIGNTLSIHNYARLVAAFGEGRARRMLMLGELLDGEEALSCGFLSRLVEPQDLNEATAKLIARLLENAPLTLKASKKAIRRVLDADLDEAEDLVALCYGSQDFQLGVAAFTAKQKPAWTGR